jgi:hypothetical protein
LRTLEGYIICRSIFELTNLFDELESYTKNSAILGCKGFHNDSIVFGDFNLEG